MNKRKFSRLVLRRWREYSDLDGYFYLANPEHLLSGFHLEVTPGGGYPWQYVFPLFDKYEFMHLGFGRLLGEDEGPIAIRSLDTNSVATEFLQRCESSKPGVEKLTDLTFFCEHIETNIGLENPVIRRSYSLALVLLGEKDRALSQIAFLLRSQPSQGCGRQHSDLNALHDMLEKDIELARKSVIGWEQQTKETLGII